MSSTTNVVWLQSNDEEPIPNELVSHVALFINEDACYQFLCSLPSALHGLTLVVTDSTMATNRLVQLKQISAVYILSSSKTKSHIKNSEKIHGLFHDRTSLINQILSDLNRTKSTKPGFLIGVMAPFQGFYFLLTHSSTWSRALVPAILFTLILFAFTIPGVWGMHIVTNRLIQKHTPRWAHIGIWLLRIVLYIVAICLSLILALITAQPLSAPALESLVRAQERDLKYPNRPEESFWCSIWRSIRVAVISILISFGIFILLTLIEFFSPIAVILTTPLKLLTTGFIIAYDIIDYPLSLHSFGVRDRTPWFRHYLWTTLGFGLAMEVIFLIPGAFLLLLPAGVCGATRLVVIAERASIDQPLLLNDGAI
jgi:CysZ protein